MMPARSCEGQKVVPPPFYNLFFLHAVPPSASPCVRAAFVPQIALKCFSGDAIPIFPSLPPLLSLHTLSFPLLLLMLPDPIHHKGLALRPSDLRFPSVIPQADPFSHQSLQLTSPLPRQGPASIVQLGYQVRQSRTLSLPPKRCFTG